MAVGRIGLSLQEFSVLTPSEFEAIYKEWEAGQEDTERGAWERCRWICYYALKPYAKKCLKPEDVLRFGWDGMTMPGSRTKMTKEELETDKKEFEKLMDLWKDE